MFIRIGSLADMMMTKSSRRCSTLPAVRHHDLLGRLAGLGAEGLNLLHNVHALDNLPEDDVLARTFLLEKLLSILSRGATDVAVFHPHMPKSPIPNLHGSSLWELYTLKIKGDDSKNML